MKSLALVAVVAALAACADSPSLVEPGQGFVPTAPKHAVEINETITPWDQVLINPCNGEAIVMTGTQTIRLHVTTTPSGATNYGFTISQTLQGTGLVTGALYNATTDHHEQGSSHDPYPIVVSFTFRTKVTSTTPIPNFYFDQTIHLTINANGVVTSETDDINEGCRQPAS